MRVNCFRHSFWTCAPCFCTSKRQVPNSWILILKFFKHSYLYFQNNPISIVRHLIVLPVNQKIILGTFHKVLTNTVKFRTLINLKKVLADLKNGLAYLLKSWNFVCVHSAYLNHYGQHVAVALWHLKMGFTTYLATPRLRKNNCSISSLQKWILNNAYLMLLNGISKLICSDLVFSSFFNLKILVPKAGSNGVASWNDRKMPNPHDLLSFNLLLPDLWSG